MRTVSSCIFVIMSFFRPFYWLYITSLRPVSVVSGQVINGIIVFRFRDSIARDLLAEAEGFP